MLVVVEIGESSMDVPLLLSLGDMLTGDDCAFTGLLGPLAIASKNLSVS